ncbi:MAG: carboxypeptidase regulatory-like domain-containing protein, partial [Armatimonadota bacterium]
NGKPVARARIVARPINDENDTIEQLPTRPFFTALTDKNGKYELLVPAGTYLVEARHPDYEPASQVVTVEESSSVTLDFQLTPRPKETGTVVGTVMAELNGNFVPVPGALVLLKPQNGIIVPLETATEETTVGQLISAQMNPSQQGLVPPGRPIRYRLFTFTKADGSFELTGVPAGTYTAIAYKPNYGRDTKTITVNANETVRVDFLLRANLGIIQGQVTDASTGQPIEKALVFAVRWNDIWFGWEDWEQNGDKWVRPMSSGGHKNGHRPIHRPVEPPIRAGTLTDANGNYNIVLPAGDYFVVAVKEGYLAVGQQVSVLGGQTSAVNFALQPVASVQ